MDEEIENLKLKLELCNSEFELYKVKYKLNDYKKMRKFRSKIQLNYNSKNIKDLKTNVIPKQLEIDTYTLSHIFIRPKNKHLVETLVLVLVFNKILKMY